MQVAQAYRDWRFVIKFLAYILLVILTGCSVFYENKHATDRVAVYSDRNIEYTKKVCHQAETAYFLYTQLFDFDPGFVKIYLSGRDDKAQELKENEPIGYYVKYFRTIRISSDLTTVSTDEGMYIVLFHELAHHFILQKYGSIPCWKNEGLACVFEQTRVQPIGDLDVAVVPCLDNPLLKKIAKKAIINGYNVADVIDYNWLEFHGRQHKMYNYAISYMICHYFLTQAFTEHIDLTQKIDLLSLISDKVAITFADEIREYIIKS